MANHNCVYSEFIIGTGYKCSISNEMCICQKYCSREKGFKENRCAEKCANYQRKQ